MGMFKRNEPETSAFRAVNASGADDPSNPVCLSSLADLETNQDFGAIVLAELSHLHGNNYCSQKRNICSSSNSPERFFMFPFLQFLYRMLGILHRNPSLVALI